MWRGGAWEGGVYPGEEKSGYAFYGRSDRHSNEPVFGYPMRSGLVKGVSDTFLIHIELYNYTGEGYDLSNYRVENWFEPAIFDKYADPVTTNPLPYPDGFGYSFQYWKRYINIVEQPDTLPDSYGSLKYELIYYIWGLPAGRFKVIMMKTSNAPDDFGLRLADVPCTWVVEPIDLADTLTAFAACWFRALERKDYEAAQSWTDSIYVRNPNSVNYYSMVSFYKLMVKDSAATIAAYDSGLAILSRQGDPLLPDTTRMTDWELNWYLQKIRSLTNCRHRLITGERPHFR